MKLLRIGGALGSLLLLAACVTINIYFPAAQAEQAAEKIIQEIIRQPAAPPAKEPAADAEKGAAATPARAAEPTVAGLLLDFLLPTAQAAEPDFNIDTPEIRRLRAQMKARHPALTPYYADGRLGFGRDGLVAIPSGAKVPLADRAALNKLMSAENADRAALYHAIADANGHPEWHEQVRATFAAKWVELAETGWWFESATGWQQK